MTAGDSDYNSTQTEYPENKCPKVVTNYIKTQYPNAQVRLVNAGKDGTGSEYGNMRFEYDVLAYEPDIVFVEHTVNDYSDSKSEISQQNMLKVKF